MARPTPATWLPLWHRALDPAEEIGIRFEVAGVERKYFATQLYLARDEAKDPRLHELIMFQPAAPLDNEIWICKKQVSLDG